MAGVGSESTLGGCSSTGEGRLGPGGEWTKAEGEIGGEGSGEVLVEMTPN